MLKIKTLRKKLGYTQLELAEKSGLSVRTIQRVESEHYYDIKGHTLNALSKALEINASEIKRPVSNFKNPDKLMLKYINLSGLLFFIIPFGNIFASLYLWHHYKKKSLIVERLGKQLVNFQLLWSIGLCIALIMAPLLQKVIKPSFSLILCVLFFMIALNIFVIFRTTIRIEKEAQNLCDSPLKFL